LLNPLAALSAPTGGTSYAAVNLSGNSTLTINPGDYPSITVAGNAVLILNSGTYIIGTGGITISGNATVKNATAAGGVLIYNTGALTVSGNAVVNLTAFSTGNYANLAIFQALTVQRRHGQRQRQLEPQRRLALRRQCAVRCHPERQRRGGSLTGSERVDHFRHLRR
jgi:hypothetical protein